MCCGSSHGWGHLFLGPLSNGWGHVLRVITWVGSSLREPHRGQPWDCGITHSEKACKCSKVVLLEASVAPPAGLPSWPELLQKNSLEQ